MIGYVTLGTNDLPRAQAFYDALFDSIGARRIYETDRGSAWGISETAPSVGVLRPFDGKPASAGNGTMIALALDSRAGVDAMHALALRLGGRDEGAPGPRGEGFYGAYFRDLDGNKLACFCLG